MACTDHEHVLIDAMNGVEDHDSKVQRWFDWSNLRSRMLFSFLLPHRLISIHGGSKFPVLSHFLGNPRIAVAFRESYH